MVPFNAHRVLLALVVGASVASGTRRGAVRGNAKLTHAKANEAKANEAKAKITPNIWRTDNHFYKHDYPHDFSPTAPLEKDFDHPYPIVQESDAFDKDYVRDENGDDGSWKAQMTYDKLRTELEKLMSQSKRIAQRKADLEKQLAAERSQEEQIRKELQAAAQRDWGAGVAVQHQTPPPPNRTVKEVNVSVGVSDATGQLEGRLKDIEDCKKQLAEAQAKLKYLQDLLKNAEIRQNQAQSRTESMERTEAMSLKTEQSIEDRRIEATTIHQRSLRTFTLEKKEMEELQKKIEEARARLYKVRYDTVDQDGGVYKVFPASAYPQHPKGAAPPCPKDKDGKKSAAASQKLLLAPLLGLAALLRA